MCPLRRLAERSSSLPLVNKWSEGTGGGVWPEADGTSSPEKRRAGEVVGLDLGLCILERGEGVKRAEQEVPGLSKKVRVDGAGAGGRSEGLRVLEEAGSLRVQVFSSSGGSLEVFVIHL